MVTSFKISKSPPSGKSVYKDTIVMFNDKLLHIAAFIPSKIKALIFDVLNIERQGFSLSSYGANKRNIMCCENDDKSHRKGRKYSTLLPCGKSVEIVPFLKESRHKFNIIFYDPNNTTIDEIKYIVAIASAGGCLVSITVAKRKSRHCHYHSRRMSIRNTTGTSLQRKR